MSSVRTHPIQAIAGGDAETLADTTKDQDTHYCDMALAPQKNQISQENPGRNILNLLDYKMEKGSTWRQSMHFIIAQTKLTQWTNNIRKTIHIRGDQSHQLNKIKKQHHLSASAVMVYTTYVAYVVSRQEANFVLMVHPLSIRLNKKIITAQKRMMSAIVAPSGSTLCSRRHSSSGSNRINTRISTRTSTKQQPQQQRYIPESGRVESGGSDRDHPS